MTTSTSYRSQKTEDIQADLTATISQITAIDAALTQGLSTASTTEYSFDSGTGSQREKFRDPADLFTLRNRLVSRRDLLRRLLANRAIIHQQTRRGGAYYRQVESDLETTNP